MGQTITIFAVGTQGDIRPFIALGQGLQGVGHQVRLCADPHYKSFIEGEGLQHFPLTADFDKIMSEEAKTMDYGLNPLVVFMTMKRRMREMAADWADQGRAAAAGADLLIGAGSATVLAGSLSEALGIPAVQAQLQPMTPCRDIPPMLLPPALTPPAGLATLYTYHFLRTLTWQAVGPAYDLVVRPALGLKPYPWTGPFKTLKPEHRRVIYGYSPAVVPPSPDWGDHIAVVGYWTLHDQRDWAPPQDLVEFLEAGEPPVYIGFGSMKSRDAERLTRVALEAAELTGRRVVLATGWGGLADTLLETPAGAGLSPSQRQVYVLKHAPHSWLFPRMAAIVHHGGAGTTGAAAGAGRPSVVLPFFGDQPFWAERLRLLGTAPKAVARKTVTGPQLAAAIEEALQPARVEAARLLGERIRSENGIQGAIDHLQRWGLIH